ncbi:MAG TPA: DNA methyltransferase [Pyrinomonadaceae bacterium]|nr:DNA methyltransferase [Pyrinomonadaceae bacterium]
MIEADNYHALQLLEYLYAGQVDCIYIDPPYNTGARDWKYNNDYVDASDAWRHSKWLSMMKRRLLRAKKLLNPADSVLIVTIDEKEYLRLGLLLEQIFPQARMQMVSIQTNPSGVRRGGEFRRSDEYAYFLRFGESIVHSLVLGTEWEQVRRTATRGLEWNKLRRTGTNTKRSDRPNLFYPIFISEDGVRIHSVGEPLGRTENRSLIEPPTGTHVAWPLRQDGTEGNWQISPSAFRTALNKGYVRLGGRSNQSFALYYLKAGEQRRVESGEYEINDRRPDGSIVAQRTDIYAEGTVPTTQWTLASHDAATHGSRMLRTLLPIRSFPFPKSLYAVEDALRFFVANKPDAKILDFFAGSGTTAHAVMRLNKQDGGKRRCISVTNNEVASSEQAALLKKGLHPGDKEWEKWGICNYITFPRIRAAISGKTPDGEPIKGDYKFNDEFPMAEGFAANLEYFKLDFLDKNNVALGRQFREILPLLWLRAGAIGPRPELPKRMDIPAWLIPEKNPFAVLVDETKYSEFVIELEKRADLTHVFLITDSEDAFHDMAENVAASNVIQLYRDYLENFMINKGDKE